MAQLNAPVENQHPEFMAFHEKWTRCRDVAAGQDAVHAAGTKYLPRLKDQEDDDYNAYRMRATFFNATWRTIDGLRGMIFRRPPKVKTPAVTEALLADVDLEGTPFPLYAQKVVEEVLKIGRLGLLVDFPTAPPNATQADAKLLNLRPRLAMYRAESIINWKTSQINNATTLSQVVLKECVFNSKSEFEEEKQTQYRVLDLVQHTDLSGASRMVYRQRIYTIVDGKQVQQGVDIFPIMNGKPLEFIPFLIQGANDVAWCCDDPPLIDLVDLNLSHYRTTADYEHGCHFTGLPTPVVSGYSPPINKNGEVDKLYIGSTAAWTFTDPNAKAEFLEFTGQGLKALESNLASKERRMAVLGARMLEEQKREVETAEAAALHRSGESSMLATTAQAVSLGLTRVLQWFSDWAGASGVATCELNRDFFPTPMTPQEMEALVKSWQAGALTQEELFDKFQEREVIRKDITFAEHQAKVEAQPPILAPGQPGAKPLGAAQEESEE